MPKMVPSGARPRLRKLSHPAVKSMPLIMRDHVTPLSEDFMAPPTPGPPFDAAYMTPALSNMIPHVCTEPVFPMSVHAGAAPGVGLGGGLGGLFCDVLDPPPQPTHSNSA